MSPAATIFQPTLFDNDIDGTDRHALGLEDITTALPMADSVTHSTSADSGEQGLERVFSRVETLSGEELLLNPARESEPPKVRDTDTVYQAHRKFLRYAAATIDPDLDPERVAEAIGSDLLDTSALPAALRDDSTIASTFQAKPNTRWVVAAGGPEGAPRIVALSGGFEKTGLFSARGQFVASENLSTQMVVKAMRRQLLDEHPEYDEKHLQEIDHMFVRLANPKGGDKKIAYVWDEAVIDSELVVAASAGWAIHTGMDSSTSPNLTMTAQAGELVDTGALDHMADSDWVRQGIGWLPVEATERSAPDGQTELQPVFRVGGWTRRISMGFVEAELAGQSTRCVRAAVLRDYRAVLVDRCGQEQGRHDTIQYIRQGAGHSATVYEQKKNIPLMHLQAGEDSVFHTSGDFTHVEVDESVDLATLAQVEAEYAKLREFLPVTTKPTLRFRKTGRHQAQGVYHPHADNIAVDPRHPSSFVHEYGHHLDFTAADKLLSLHLPWVRSVANRLPHEPGIEDTARTASFWATPTEIVARSLETYFVWTGFETSLAPTAEQIRIPPYRPLEDHKNEIVAFWDQVFAEHGGIPLSSRPDKSSIRSGLPDGVNVYQIEDVPTIYVTAEPPALVLPSGWERVEQDGSAYALHEASGVAVEISRKQLPGADSDRMVIGAKSIDAALWWAHGDNQAAGLGDPPDAPWVDWATPNLGLSLA